MIYILYLNWRKKKEVNVLFNDALNWEKRYSYLYWSRCSSVVKSFAYGSMGRRIDLSLGGPNELFLVPASVPRLVYQRYVLFCLWYIKEPLLLIGKSIPCSGSGFPLLLSEWFFTICLTPVLNASLNKTFPSLPLWFVYMCSTYFRAYIYLIRPCCLGSNHFIPSRIRERIRSYF